MCKVLKIHPSGYYGWLEEPLSRRSREDEYLLGFIKQFWLESGSNYGYRKVYKDMISIGEQCGKNRVHRLMKAAGIQSERGYKRKRITREAILRQSRQTCWSGSLKLKHQT
jgi:putative transposase